MDDPDPEVQQLQTKLDGIKARRDALAADNIRLSANVAALENHQPLPKEALEGQLTEAANAILAALRVCRGLEATPGALTLRASQWNPVKDTPQYLKYSIALAAADPTLALSVLGAMHDAAATHYGPAPHELWQRALDVLALSDDQVAALRALRENYDAEVTSVQLQCGQAAAVLQLEPTTSEESSDVASQALQGTTAALQTAMREFLGGCTGVLSPLQQARLLGAAQPWFPDWMKLTSTS